MKTKLDTENWKIGWSEVGNYTFHNKTTEQSMTIPRDILHRLAKEVMGL